MSTTQFQPLDRFAHPLQQVAMPIVTRVDDRLLPAGTGFMIGTNLLMTAAHVMKYATQPRRRIMSSSGEFENLLECYALYVADERHGPNNEHYVGGPLPLGKAWISNDVDIALCSVRRPIDIRTGKPLDIPNVALTASIPRIGERIWGFGYHAIEGRVDEQLDNKEFKIVYQHDTAVSTGHILETHIQYRDRGLLRFPCFRTSARFVHGMSGGPIFNSAGAVCGVITSGSSFEDDSYGSLLWAAFGCRVEAQGPTHDSIESLSLLELAQRGHVTVDESLQAVSIVEHSDGTRKVVLDVHRVHSQGPG